MIRTGLLKVLGNDRHQTEVLKGYLNVELLVEEIIKRAKLFNF
jgi:hypothetical protein